ncbi:iron-containing alcohol dehydrogenase [Sediminispirochaeta bajacaliforniensis]|uniref:iron-containing alcohol dehydrogenase n=1 Tax=Sediminispirochaeta bajacaliforniensis TaxID=148 RepID=UPI0003756321|nr:iron-containing alcohol dehydrogenase [Sediminispirochaeta bajacaliforniensis]
MKDFWNPTKLNAGLKALDTLAGELASRSSFRPLFLLSPELGASFRRLLRRGTELRELLLVYVPEAVGDTDLVRLKDMLLEQECDGLVAVGGFPALSAARRVALQGTDALPVVALPCGSYRGSGVGHMSEEAVADVDVAILDPRLFRYGCGNNLSAEQNRLTDTSSGSLHGQVWAHVGNDLWVGSLSARSSVMKRYLQALSLVVRELSSCPIAANGAPSSILPAKRVPAYFEFTGRGRVVSGQGALSRLPELLVDAGGARPMLLSDPGVAAAGLTTRVEKLLSGAGIPPAVVDTAIPSDSDIETVRRLASLYRERHCDALVAVGGGSVIDTAKGVNILAGYGGESLSDFAGAGKINRRLPPLVVLPSTSGTGSEATLVAVIADHAEGKKLLYTSPFLQPDIALLDPEMTLSLPPFLTAATGMDALTHAVEAWFCLGHNPVSDRHALTAISLVGEHLLHVVANPDDVSGRTALAQASNLAGLAFSNSMVGMIHTLGHSVGAACGVHHGMAMAILLPLGIEYNLSRIGGDLGPVLEALTGTSSSPAGPALIAEVRRMNEELHRITEGLHPRSFSEVRDRKGNPLVREEDLPRIAMLSQGDGSVLYNPEELDYDDALRVLKAAYEGVSLHAS